MRASLIIGDDGSERGEDALALGHVLAEALSAAPIVTTAARGPARALHALAESEDPIAIVIGSAHRGMLGRALLGSVGSALISRGRHPIAVAPHGYAKCADRGLLRIGVAVDGSPESWGALATSGALASRTGAELDSRDGGFGWS